MTSLAACLKRAKNLTAEDKDLINNAYAEFKGEDGAAMRAIDDAIGVVEGERGDLVKRIEKKGGYVEPRLEPKKAEEKKPEPVQPKEEKKEAPVAEQPAAEKEKIQTEATKEPKANFTAEADFEREMQRQDVRDALSAMKDQFGWAEEGGRILRDQVTGQVSGRTSWIPKAPWWPDKPSGITAKTGAAAVEKALSGGRLGKKQHEFVEWLIGIHNEEQRLDALVPEDDLMGSEGLTENDSLDAALVSRAVQIDEDAVERLSIQHQDDSDAFMRAIKEIVDAKDKGAEIGVRGEEVTGEEEILSQYTEEDLAKRAQEAQEREKTEKEAATKAEADKAREGFILTGSDREIDELAARGQDELKFSYAGARSLTADKDALSRATQMQQEGKDSEEIRQETGWFLGPEGRWRYEIPDTAMKIRPDAKTQPGREGVPPHWLLGDLIDHPKLFEAYPELKDVKVETKPGESGGMYSPTTNTISVSQARRRSILAHEIQHIIQSLEGFARGGTRRLFETRASEFANQLSDIRLNDPKVRGLYRKATEAYIARDGDKAMEYFDIADRLTRFQAYRRLAGEIEARDVQARQDMSAVERRITEPYATQGIPQEDAIVFMRETEAALEGEGQTPDELRGVLAAGIGKRKLAKMESTGLLKIIETVDEFPPGISGQFKDASMKGKRIRGLWDGKTAWLVSGNIAPGQGLGTLLHEAGEHAGMEKMLGPRYKSLVNQFNRLVKEGDKTALGVLDQVPESTPDRYRDSERLAYLIENVVNADAGTTISARARRLVNRIIAAIRAWAYQTKFMQALEDAGVGMELQPRDFAELARAAMDFAIENQPGATVTPQFSVQTRDDLIAEARKKINPKKDYMQKLRDVKAAPREYAGDVWDRIEQGIFDRFHGLLMAEKKEGIPQEQQAYVATRLGTSLQDPLAVLLRHAQLEWQGNILQPKANTEGFLKILEPVSDRLEDFGTYLVGLRAEKLQADGKETGFTPDQIEAMVSLGRGDSAFETAQEKYIEINKSVLDIAERAGLIDPDSRAVWESDVYLPFHRILEEGGTAIGPKGRKGLSHQTAGIRRLKGSEKAIGDPLENIIKNWVHLLDASLKNNAMRQAVDNLSGSGWMDKAPWDWKKRLIPLEEAKKKVVEAAQEQGLDPEVWDILSSSDSLEGLRKMISMEAPTGKNVVRVMRDGHPEFYTVNDDLLLRSLTSINQQSWGKMMNIFRTPKRWLTAMVTADPAFMARNFTRDVLSAWVLGRDKFKLGIDGMKGAAQAWQESDDVIRNMAAGGMFVSGGYLNAHDPTAVSRFIKAEMEHRDFRKTLLSSPKKLWDFWQRVGAAAENGNRVALAMAGQKAGKPQILQAFESKDLMDFSMRGDYALIQFLAESVPFLSARLQGLHRLGRGAIEDPKSFALKGALIAAAALALHFRNSDDERYQALEEWDRDTYFHFFIGEDHYRLPKPFEVGVLFGTLPERLADSLSGDRTWDVFWEQMYWNMKETLAISPVPQTVAPALEQWANRSAFTGRPIVGARLERLAPEAQFEPWTSDTMRALGEATGQSPKRLEAIFQGYLGTIGAYILGASDIATRHLAGYPSQPSIKAEDMPVLRSFYRGSADKNTRFSTEFYDMLKEVNQLHNAINEYRRQGDTERSVELRLENVDKLRYRKRLNTVQRRLASINRSIRRLHLNKAMTPEEKRTRIDRLVERKNQLVRTTMESIEGQQEQ